MEGAAKPIITRWQEPRVRPQPEDVLVMAQFLALMYARVPRAVEAVREIETTVSVELLKMLAERPDDLRAQLERYKAETGDRDAPSLEDLTDSIRHFEERFTLDVDDRRPLAVAILATPEITKQLLTMTWCICDAPSGEFFITGDCPMAVFVPITGRKAMFGGGLALPAVEVTFPLSPAVCLLLDRKGGALRRRVGAQFVREVNRRTAYVAERFVISTYQTKRVAECVRAGAVSVGRPKTDKGVLIRRLRARITSERRATGQAPPPEPDAPRGEPDPSGP
jgi:hypothetical protein